MSRPPRPLRARLTRWSAWALLAAVTAATTALATPRGRGAVEGAALALLERAPPNAECGATVGRLAALTQGTPLPEDSCLGSLAEDRLARALLVRLARDPARPVPVRASALAALLRAEPRAAGLVTALLSAPGTSPEMRRAALAVALRNGDALLWATRAAASGPHGVHDPGLAHLFALGEPDLALALRALLGASPAASVAPEVLADVYAGLGTDAPTLREAVARHARGQLPVGLPSAWWPAFWRNDCADGCVALVRDILALEADARREEAPATPPAPRTSDPALELLYAEDGPAADHVRGELGAVANWIGQVSEPRRAARLAAAVLHPDAAVPDPATATREAGDPHAVLRRAAGSPGAVALVAADLAASSRVPLTVWVFDGGVGLTLGGLTPGERAYAVEMCAPARALDAPAADWSEVPAGGVEALALVEGAAAALRAGDPAGARLRLDAARGAWPAAPGLDAIEASVLAREGPPPVAPPSTPPASSRRGRRAAPPPAELPRVQVGPLLGVQAPDALLVSRPAFVPTGRGRRSAPPVPPDLRVAVREALLGQVDRIVALAPVAADRLRAAWFAADGGHLELARALLERVGDPAALPPALVPLRDAVLRATEGPTPEPGAMPTAEGAVPCPAAFRADPPASAWRGGAEAELRPAGPATEPG